MKRSGKLWLIALLLLCLVAFAACNNETPPANGEGEGENEGENERQVLRIAMECDYAPFNWLQAEEGVDEEGNVYTVPVSGNIGYTYGYDVAFAKRIAEGLDMDLEIVRIEWGGLIPALEADQVDAVIAGMSPTAERRESVDFSHAYYTSDLVIVVAKDGPYATATSLADFAGAKITGQQSTFHYNVIDQIEGVDKQEAMETFPAMILALESGRIDGYISERPGALSAQAANPNLTFISFPEGEGFEATADDTSIAVAVKKGNQELLDKINPIIDAVDEQTRSELMDEAIALQPLAE